MAELTHCPGCGIDIDEVPHRDFWDEEKQTMVCVSACSCGESWIEAHELVDALPILKAALEERKRKAT